MPIKTTRKYINLSVDKLTVGNGAFNLPQIDGTIGQSLITDGAGNVTWQTVSGAGSVTSITAGVGLNGGTITTSGTIDLANTTVTPGSYTSANITVDAQGRITAAANGTGGGGVTIGSAQQIPYVNAGGTDFDYSSNLIYDGTIFKVLSGTNNRFEVNLMEIKMTSDTANARSTYDTYSNFLANSAINMYRGRGTEAVPQPVQLNDKIGEILFGATNAAGSTAKVIGSGIYVSAAENWSPGNAGTEFRITTYNIGGGQQTRFKIQGDGSIKFNEAYAFPTTDGTINQVLSTNGAGVLSWADAGAASSITLTAGIGLSGGGDLTANRTFDLDIPSLPAFSEISVAANDTLVLYNTSALAHEEITFIELATAFSEKLGLSPINGVIYSASTWTDNADGTITIPTVDVVLYDDQNWAGTAYRYTVTGGTTGTGITALTDESTNYIYLDYNAGTPQWVVTTSEPDYKRSDFAKYITLYRAGTFIHALDWEFEGSGLSNKILQRLYETRRLERASGLTISAGGSDPLQVNIESGDVWNGINRELTPTVDSWSGTFFSNYHSAGVWARTVSGPGSGTANNTNYDDGTNLVALAAGKYVTNWYYKGVETGSHVYEVVGRGEYNTVAEAQLETAPPVPELVESHTILVGRIICQQGNSSPVTIESAFDNAFASTSVIAHNDLSGIQGGIGGEHYHLTQAEHTFLTTTTFAQGSGASGKIALWNGTNTVTSDNGLSWFNGGGDPIITIEGTSFNSATSIGGATIQHSVDGYAQIFASSFSNSQFPIIQMQRKLGTRSAPVDTSPGSSLGRLRWSGGAGEGAVIEAFATETHSVGNSGTTLNISTTPNGTTTFQTRIKIDQDGAIGMPSIASDSQVFVYGNTAADRTYGLKAGNNGVATVAPKYGLYAYANGTSAVQSNIGGYFVAAGNTSANYSVKLVDGTQARSRVLTDMTGNGDANWAELPYDLPFACGDESTPIVVASSLTTLRSPRRFRLSNVKASLTVAGSTSGTTIVDILVNGVSILSTLITIDFGDTTSATAATPPVISSPVISDDDEITVDVRGITGGGTEAGLKVYLIGYIG